MSLLQYRKLFGHEAAEDEQPERLAEYFVMSRDFEDFHDENESFLIVKGKKGVGKSAVLSFFAQKLKAEDQFSISVRGAALSCFFEPKNDDPNTYVNEWQKAICSYISTQLGKQIGIALSDDEISIVEHAEIEGIKEKNIVKSLLDRFKFKIGSIELKGTVSPISRNLIQRYLNESYNDNIWLFVDDIDQTFINSINNKYKISTFFTACRYLTKDIPSLKIRASIRDDVWWSITREDEALDKVPQFIRSIKWRSSDTVRILGKRIDVFVKHLEEAKRYLDNSIIKKPFFSVFPEYYAWRQDNIPSPVLIHMFSMGRPRWAIQLGRQCIENARRNLNVPKKINLSLLLSTLSEFSTIKLNDIIAEYDHDCPLLREVIFSFYSLNSMWSTSNLEKFIKDNLINKCNVSIDDNNYPAANQVAHFLYRIGFINAFIPSEKTIKNDYFRYEEKPHLLTMELNNDDQFHWSIHPCFHPVLNLSLGYKPNKKKPTRKPPKELPV